MSELTLRQIERIDRYKLSRHRPERTPLQKWVRWQVFVILPIVVAMILAACVLMAFEWSPGNQAAIAAEFKAYRALRHDAVNVEKW